MEINCVIIVYCLIFYNQSVSFLKFIYKQPKEDVNPVAWL